MKKVIFTAMFILFAASSAFAQQKTIVGTAVAADNFNTLVTAVKAAGLVDTLNGHTEFTVFAPTDEAFAKLDKATLQSLLKPENKDQLTRILTYHVVPGTVSARAAYPLNSATTVSGQPVSIDFRSGELKVGNANVVKTDIACSNGTIHVIDTVLLPQLENIPAVAKSAKQFNTLLAAVTTAELASVLDGKGPFTVLAPTDDAFAALPKGTVDSLLKKENRQQLVDILKYHVISGRVSDIQAAKAGSAKSLLGRSLQFSVSENGLMVNDALVSGKNISAANGVIHVINKVLIPSKMSHEEVMTFMNETVQKGAPMYNAGHHGQCAKVYMSSLEQVMETGIAKADERTMSSLSATIEKAKKTHSMTERAWVLREGIDNLYQRVATMSGSIQTSR